MKVLLPELLWYGRSSLAIDLPDDWDVELCPMRGAHEKALTAAEMAAAIRAPIGTTRLAELARGKRRAVILFDDMTRPTPVDVLGQLVVDELLAAGMREDDISFVCALGTHGALSQVELRKKVGSRLLERFRVYNHNCYEQCVDVGVTSRGTPLKVNRELMQADLKIGLGCVTAHAQAGFSGGGKIVLPGAAHIDSIAHYHIEVQRMAPETTGLGRFDDNVMRLDIEEAVRMVGLDFKVDVLVNELGETSHVFAGDVLRAHAQAVALAKQHYALAPRPRDKQVMICNAFIKPNEMPIAYLVGLLGLRGMQGSVVVIANAPEGQVVHYLLGRFGRDYGGRQYPISPVIPSAPLVIQAPHFDRTFGDWFANPEAITFTRDFEETRALLRARHGPGTKVGVVPSATMAYYGA